MPAPRCRLACCAAALAFLLGLAPPAPAAARTAAEAQRLAEFARRYKALQQHLLLEGAERSAELEGRRFSRLPGLWEDDEAPAGERIGLPPDPAELAGQALGAPLAQARRALQPAGLAALAINVRANDPTSDSPGATQSEVSLAANGDNLLVAFNDGQGVGSTHTQGYAWSDDAGQSFTDGGTPPTVPGYLWDSDPLTAVNEGTGEFWYAGLNSNNVSGTNGIGIVKATIASGAITWGTPRLVRAVSSSQTVLDKEWMAVDPASGRLYVVYTTFQGAGDFIEIQYSSDDGVTWSSPQRLSDPADDGYVQGARVGVGPGGEVYVTWYVIGRAAPYQDWYPVRKSINGGATFAPATVAARVFSNFGSGAPGFNRPRSVDFPTLAVDRSNGPRQGRVYVGWQEGVDFYSDNVGTGGAVPEAEPNDLYTQANTFVLGAAVTGTLTQGPPQDLDFFRFTAIQGQTVILYAQNQGTGLDFSLRLLCGDGNTQLAVAAAGVGQDNIIVFTIPTTGTYYVRLKQLSGPTSAAYTLHTGVHSNPGDDRARDHRDVFVVYSDDGVVWKSPKRVNSDPAYLDDWLPEIAVSNGSKVYASWYDWRDASSAICNAQSQVYLASSSDGGDTWSELGALTDAPSDWTDWTNAKSNLSPNQGDYNVLYADCQAVYGGWGDVRDPDVNVYTGRYPQFSQPTLVTFANVAAQPHLVTLTWQSHGGTLTGEVQRRAPGGAWVPQTPTVTADGAGRMVFADATVSPGTTYEYQLVVPPPPTPATWITCAVRVGVPFEVFKLALGPVRPNPTQTDIIVTLSLPSSAPATVQILDLAGRKVYDREVGSLGPGNITLNLGSGVSLRSGIYFLRLSQSGHEAIRRITVVR